MVDFVETVEVAWQVQVFLVVVLRRIVVLEFYSLFFRFGFVIEGVSVFGVQVKFNFFYYFFERGIVISFVFVNDSDFFDSFSYIFVSCFLVQRGSYFFYFKVN